MTGRNQQTKQNPRGGRRSNAGRKCNRVPRSHRTYWVSEAEHRFICEYLLKNRINDPPEE